MTSEIHGALAPFFKDLPATEKERSRQLLVKHFASVADQLDDKPYLLGEQMTIADPYLFWLLRAAPISGVELPKRLQVYFARMQEMPSVAQALAEEGLARD
jgi:glutathione S-transferase